MWFRMIIYMEKMKSATSAKHDRLNTIGTGKKTLHQNHGEYICHLHEVYGVGSRTDEVDNGTHHGLQGGGWISWVALRLEMTQLSDKLHETTSQT